MIATSCQAFACQNNVEFRLRIINQISENVYAF